MLIVLKDSKPVSYKFGLPKMAKSNCILELPVVLIVKMLAKFNCPIAVLNLLPIIFTPFSAVESFSAVNGLVLEILPVSPHNLAIVDATVSSMKSWV